jgi:hypothetical protein
MPRYFIHRIKEAPGEHFRWAAHTGGLAIVKRKDYEQAGELDAATPYAAWKMLAEENRPLQPGDILEAVNEDGSPGDLKIVKYIGFEPAQWYVPDPKIDTGTQATETSESAVSLTPSHPL